MLLEVGLGKGNHHGAIEGFTPVVRNLVGFVCFFVYAEGFIGCYTKNIIVRHRKCKVEDSPLTNCSFFVVVVLV